MHEEFLWEYYIRWEIEICKLWLLAVKAGYPENPANLISASSNVAGSPQKHFMVREMIQDT